MIGEPEFNAKIASIFSEILHRLRLLWEIKEWQIEKKATARYLDYKIRIGTTFFRVELNPAAAGRRTSKKDSEGRIRAMVPRNYDVVVIKITCEEYLIIPKQRSKTFRFDAALTGRDLHDIVDFVEAKYLESEQAFKDLKTRVESVKEAQAFLASIKHTLPEAIQEAIRVDSNGCYQIHGALTKAQLQSLQDEYTQQIERIA